MKKLAPRIKADILMGPSLMDPICPTSTQFAVYIAIKGDKSTGPHDLRRRLLQPRAEPRTSISRAAARWLMARSYPGEDSPPDRRRSSS